MNILAAATTDIVSVEAESSFGFNILQCNLCRSIIGDTSSLESFNKESNYITVHKKSEMVIVDAELETSKGDFDYGSTFNRLICKNCNEYVGRTYRTTAPELDLIRGKFSFDLKNILMFEVSGFDGPNLSNNISTQKAAPIDQIEIIKLQKFVLALYDRLEQLEAENDMLKSELSSISNKVESFSDSFSLKRSDSSLSSGPSKAVKHRKARLSKDLEMTTPQNSSNSNNPAELIKTIAAMLVSDNFADRTAREQSQIISSFDDELALESISWSILNSGRVREIDF